MSTSTRQQTPPSQCIERVRTPDAPHHGALFDNNGPLSPRRSRRPTTNPYSSFDSTSNRSMRNGATTTPPPQSSPPSPPVSPPATGSRRSPALSRHKQARDRASKLQAPKWDPTGLLLTPAKTPKALTPPSTGIPRRLNFQLADPSLAMPTPRKLKKHARSGESGIYGGRSGVEEVEVYNDWNARVPTIDESADNPFTGPPTPASRPRNRLRKSGPKPLAANISDEEMHERVENDEGMIFTFRGKQVFRPYIDTLNSVEETMSLGYKPIRRSNKPLRRLAFGTQQVDLDEVDEEAVTDIDDEREAQETIHPPDNQTTAGVEKVSPFSEWARTKSGSRKREADIEATNDASKRAKSDLKVTR